MSAEDPMIVEMVNEVQTVETTPITSREPALFSANEKVLIFHGPLIYEGKVLSVPKPKPNDKTENPLPTYLIHYSGWNKKWDEVVPQSRVLKYNEENLKRQKEHKIAHEASLRIGTGKKTEGKASGGGRPSLSVSTTKNAPSVTGDSSNASVGDPAGADPSEDTPKGLKSKAHSSVPPTLLPETIQKKKKLEAFVESEVRFVNKQVVELALPERLKLVLVDDFDKINRQKKLLKLPGRHTVDNFLDVYKRHLEVNSKTPDSQLLFVEGIKDFFNMLIGGQLLYPFERQQYSEFVKQVEESEERAKENDNLEPLTMSAFYGPVHLVRLFSKLGTSLAFTTMEEIPLMIFKNYSQDMFQYMARNESDLFQPKRDYTMSLPDYQRNGPL